MNEIIAGNICSLCAMITDAISGTRKKHRQILGIQCLSQVFYGAGSIILKGYSSTAQNIAGIFRNLAAMKGIRNKAVEWALILLGVVLGIVFNNRGLLGWLPIIANLEYSVAVFRFRNNEKSLKICFIVNMLMFAVFSAVIRNYVGLAGNTFVAATTAVSLFRNNKKDTSPDGAP